MMNIKSLKNIVNNKDNFLIDGKYSFNDDYSQFSNIENDFIFKNYSQNDKNSWKDIIKKVILRLIFNDTYVVHSKNKIFNGICMIPTSTNNSLKISNDNTIMTYYFNSEDCKKMLSKKRLISSIFATPETIEEKNNFYIEKRINYKDFDKEKIIEYILHSYSDNVKNSLPKYQEKKLEFFKRKVRCKEIIQHGDLWNGNILYDGQYYIIDYELVDHKYFLYDFFFYIYSYYDFDGNDKLLNNYFNGKYDELLTDYFKKFGEVYSGDERINYFKIFLSYFYYDRFHDKSTKRKSNKKVELNNVITKYEGDK